MERIDPSEGRRLFGFDPAGYDAARPGHAGEVYEVLVERCGLAAGTGVIEVGPGTGQATRPLLEVGADPLVAIEPNPALAHYLTAALGDRVQVRMTALEDAELEPSSFDLAVAASSFHWVDEAAGLAGLHDALRPGGWIALWWTLFGEGRRKDAFMQAIDHLFVDMPQSPTSGRDTGRPAFALDVEARTAALRGSGFRDFGHELFRWPASWDTAGIRGLYATFSPIRRLDEERREPFLDEIARIAERDFGGRVERTLTTSLYTARKPI